MKKLTIIAAALLLGLVSCTKFESETPLDVVSPSDPTIAISDVKDDSFTATITAAQGTGFYSYAILPGKAKEISAETILKVQAKAPFQATNDFSEVPTVIVVADGLDFNQTYTVYAVAASVQGTPGNVITQEVLTTDNARPEIVDSDLLDDNVVAILFNEPVTYVEGKTVTVDYYAVYGSNFTKYGKPEGTASVKVVAEGKQVTFTVDGLPAGAVYTLSYPEGTFVDALSNKAEALESSVFLDETGTLDVEGLVARMPVKNFSLSLADSTLTVVKDVTDKIRVRWPENVTLGDYDGDAVGSLTYSNSLATHTYKTSYPVDFAIDSRSGLSGGLVNIYPNRDPERQDPSRGDNLTMVVPTFLTDIYGNQNEPFTVGPLLYTYGYTFDDVVGTYANSGKSIYTGYDEDPFTMEIVRSDDAKKGNVMLTNYCGISTKLYADFDFDLGTLTVPAYFEPLGYEDAGNYFIFYFTCAYYSCEEDMGNDLVLYMTESGEFTDGNDYPGYYYEIYAKPASGNVSDIPEDAKPVGIDYNCFYPVFTSISAEPGSVAAMSAAPASSKKFPSFTKKGFSKVTR